MSIKNTVQYLNHCHSNQLKVFDIWGDYYRGGGRQWNIRGQVTRSGKFMVDKVEFNQFDNYYLDFYMYNDNYDYTNIYNGTYTNPIRQDTGPLSDITKKRMWDEANVLDFTIDEGARAVKGHGDVKFNLNDNLMFTEMWNEFFDKSRGQQSITKIAQGAKIYGQQPIMVSQDRFRLLHPKSVYFEGI